MNFYQNTNSRTNHHHHDQRVYPTKVSNKHSTGASIVGTKPNGTKQHILVTTTTTTGGDTGLTQKKYLAGAPGVA
jgi:hypothetical protein